MGAPRGQASTRATPPADAPTTMRVAPITMRVAPTRWGTNEQRRMVRCQAERGRAPNSGHRRTARRRVAWCQAERCQAPTDGDDAEYTCVCGTDQAERQRPEAWGAVPSGTVSGPRPTAMLQSALEMGGRMDAALVGVAPTVWGGTTQCGRREVRHRRGDAARRCANQDACGAHQVGHQRAEACGMVPSRTEPDADRRQSAECTRSQRSRATRSSGRRCAMHFRERSGVTRPQSAFESGWRHAITMRQPAPRTMPPRAFEGD